jgi:hypothetical protein
MQRRLPWRTVAVLALLGVVVLSGNTPSGAVTEPFVTVAAAGDIAWSAGPQTASIETASLIGDLSPNAVLPLGDEQYNVGALEEFDRSYDLTWGSYGAIAYPVPGNHEYETKLAKGYLGYFGAPGNSAKPSSVLHDYYSYDLGAWHMIALDDNCSIIDCRAERRWLQSDLATNTHACELAYEHKPNLKDFGSLLASGNVDVRLTGHKHIYERTPAVNGLQTFIVGTGGKSHGTYPSGLPPGGFADNTDFGILELRLGAGSYDWRFLATDGYVDDAPGGVEAGSGTCHAP